MEKNKTGFTFFLRAVCCETQADDTLLSRKNMATSTTKEDLKLIICYYLETCQKAYFGTRRLLRNSAEKG